MSLQDMSEADFWDMYRDRNGIDTEETAEQYAAKASFVAFDKLEQIFSAESIIACKFCRSRKVTYTTAQLRSADEAETFLCQCNECHKKFRIN